MLKTALELGVASCAASLFSSTGGRGRGLRSWCVGKNCILGGARGRCCAKRTSVSEGEGIRSTCKAVDS